jgi:hypothetical protein
MICAAWGIDPSDNEAKRSARAKRRAEADAVVVLPEEARVIQAVRFETFD